MTKTLKRKLSRTNVDPLEERAFKLSTASSSLTTIESSYPVTWPIAHTQTRCDFTTQTLIRSEDAVYTAAFGSQSRALHNDHNRHPIIVSLLGTSPPIPFNLPNFGLLLDECSSVPFNFSSISSFVSNVMKKMELPAGLNAESIHW
jgi:hypothetical protein